MAPRHPLTSLPRPGDRAVRPHTARPRAGSAGPRIGILGIQGDVSEHAVALAKAGARPQWVKRPADLDGIGGLVLPGGESTTLRRLLDYEGLLEAIRDRIEGGMPVFGTCAGAILLADDVAGGETTLLSIVPMSVRRNAWGRQRESFVTELDVRGLSGGPLPAVFIRAPVIDHVGPGVDVLATIDGTVALAESDRALVATFHPELTPDRRLHARFVERVAAAGRARSARAS